MLMRSTSAVPHVVEELVQAAQASDVASFITNTTRPDSSITSCNRAFLNLSGYRRSEVVGQPCSILFGPKTDRDAVRRLHRAVEKRVPAAVQLVQYLKDGATISDTVTVAPAFDRQGRCAAVLWTHAQSAKPADSTRPSFSVDCRDRIAALTPRQRAVLLAKAEGKLAKQVAYDLSLSERTVKMHLSSALAKLGVKTPMGAMHVLYKAGYWPEDCNNDCDATMVAPDELSLS